MALDPAALADKIKKIYKAKKRDSDNIGTGEDINPPPFYLAVPVKEVKGLLGGINYPGQRVLQFVGGPNSGKTTFGMLCMVAAQKGYYDKDMKYVAEGINIILVDTEKKFSKTRFIKMGGDPKKLFKVDATTLEDAYFGINQTLFVIYEADPNAKVLIVFDSLGNTPANAEAEAEADESVQMAVAAKINNRNIRSLVARYFSKKDIMCIFINQNYANMGSPGKTNKGGQGVDFACSNILQFSRVANIVTENAAGEKVAEGITSRIVATKNHTQVSETSLYEIKVDIYAYEVKGLTKYKINGSAEWVGDDCRIQVTKAKKKDNQVTYIRVMDDTSSELHMKPVTSTYEELLKVLEDGNFENVAEEQVVEETK